MSHQLDAIVLGLGGTGSAAAHRLAERGARVLGLDGGACPHGPEVETPRVIRHAYPDDPAHVPMLVRACELWRHLERSSGLDLLRFDGGVMVGAGGGRLVGEAVRAAQQWGAPYEVLGGSEAGRWFPGFRAGDDEFAVYDPWTGVVRPSAAVAAQLRQARRFGAQLRFEEGVLGWDSRGSGRGVRVATRIGTYLADHLVVCPGAWAPGVLPDLGIEFRVERLAEARFRTSTPPAGVGTGKSPILLWEDRDGRRFSASRTARDPSEVTVTSGSGAPCPPDQVAEDASASHVGELVQRASRRWSVGVGTGGATGVLTARAGDEHLVLGNHPRHDAVTVAGAMSDHGAGFLPVIGEILADLVLDGATTHPIELFAADRESTDDSSGIRI